MDVLYVLPSYSFQTSTIVITEMIFRPVLMKQAAKNRLKNVEFMFEYINGVHNALYRIETWRSENVKNKSIKQKLSS